MYRRKARRTTTSFPNRIPGRMGRRGRWRPDLGAGKGETSVHALAIECNGTKGAGPGIRPLVVAVAVARALHLRRHLANVDHRLRNPHTSYAKRNMGLFV